jgi:hypothetical protein
MNIAGMRKLMQGLLRQRVQEYQQEKNTQNRPTEALHGKVAKIQSGG